MLVGHAHQVSQPDPPTHVTDQDHSSSPTWKQLISRTLATDERIPLITKIFSHRDQAGMVGHLYGDDAQAFIDIVDEVRLRSPSPPKNGWVNSRANFYALPVRC